MLAGKPVWVDANQGWEYNRAVRLARELALLGVKVLEQPLAAGNITGYAELVRRSDIPIVWMSRSILRATCCSMCEWAHSTDS